MGNIKSSQLKMPEFTVAADGNSGVQIDAKTGKAVMQTPAAAAR